MSSLRELQAGFRAALLAGDERGVAPDVVDDGVNASARLAVYRHHVRTSLTAALEATFPVVCRLVDWRFFGWLADCYVRAHPPAGAGPFRVRARPPPVRSPAGARSQPRPPPPAGRTGEDKPQTPAHA